jgi:hypothetical protein
MHISNLYYFDHYLASHHTLYEIQKVSFIGSIGFFSPTVLHQVWLMPASILCISLLCLMGKGTISGRQPAIADPRNRSAGWIYGFNLTWEIAYPQLFRAGSHGHTQGKQSTKMGDGFPISRRRRWAHVRILPYRGIAPSWVISIVSRHIRGTPMIQFRLWGDIAGPVPHTLRLFVSNLVELAGKMKVSSTWASLPGRKGHVVLICPPNFPWWTVTEYWYSKIAGRYPIADSRYMT